MSEWMKVMLEEIARKKAEAEQALIEERRRCDEQITPPCNTDDRARGSLPIVIESSGCARET
jgi:hypothetical protein